VAGIDLRLVQAVSLTGGPSALPGEKEIQESDERLSPTSRKFVRWIGVVPSSRISLATSATVSSSQSSAGLT